MKITKVETFSCAGETSFFRSTPLSVRRPRSSPSMPKGWPARARRHPCRAAWRRFRRRARHGAGAGRGRRARPRRHPRSPDAQAHQARPRRNRDRRACGDRHRPLGPEGESVPAADLQIAGRRVAHAHPVLRIDRQQRRPGRRWRGEGGRGEVQGGTAVGDQDPLGRRARGDRRDIAGDIAKARAVRKLVGDDFPLAFDANNRYSIGAAIRVGRALEDLGYLWFEEPVEYYHPKAMGEVAQRLDITVSAGEQSYTLQSVAALIDSGVRMVQPDIVKMGGVTGLMQCAALCHAHGVEFVPTRRSPRSATPPICMCLRPTCGRPSRRSWPTAGRDAPTRSSTHRNPTPDAWSYRMERGWASRSMKRCWRVAASTSLVERRRQP